MSEPICQNCHWYRVKGELGGGRAQDEIGKCDNVAFHEQVITSGRGLLERLHLDKRDIRAALELRVRGDFGCRHFQEESDHEP